MPVSKGINNFKKDKDAKMAFLKSRIDLHLSHLRKSKAKFLSKSQVADYLCLRLTEDKIAEWESNGKKTLKPKPVAKSTLYRNPEYAAKIDSFMAGLPPTAGIDNISISSNPEVARALVTQQKAEISNLKDKIRMLEKYIANSGIKDSQKDVATALTVGNSSNDFAQTARALSLMLEASDGLFYIEDGKLVIATRMVNNVVADKRTMAPFIRWMKNQGANK